MQDNRANCLKNLAANLFPAKPGLADIKLPRSLAACWDMLCATAGVAKPQFAQAIASACDMQVARQLKPDPAVIKLLPEAFARAQCVMPLAMKGDRCVTVLTNCRRIWPHGNSIMYRRCKASCQY